MLKLLTIETFDSNEGGTATLDTATASDFVTRFAFDLASNRKTVEKQTGSYDSAPGGFTAHETTAYTYDANDRLLTEVKTVPADSARDRNTRYAYDGTTQISKTVKTGTVLDSGTDVEVVTQTFNAMGRMDAVTVVKDGNTTETLYEYNDRGLRTKATETVNGDSANAKATLYHFDPSGGHTGYAQVLEEGIDADGDGQSYSYT